MNKLVLLLIAIFTLAACKNTTGKTEQPAETVALGEKEMAADTIPDSSAISTEVTKADDKKTTIYFPKKSFNFGKITEGDVVTHIFSFTNSGDEPLEITSAQASCGCTVPEYSKKPIAPGEKGQIKVSFDSKDKEGPTTKGIFIEANTEPQMTILQISADIQPRNKKAEGKDIQPTKEEKEQIKQQQDQKM